MTASRTSQAKRACPALLICMAPTRSACSSKPHARRACTQVACETRSRRKRRMDVLVRSLPLGLNRDRPVIPPPGHGDISRCCLDLPAVDKPNPSSPGQENPIPIQLETLRVSKGIDALAFFLEPGKPLRILLILFDLQSLFICLACLCRFNYTLVYGEKQRDSNRRHCIFNMHVHLVFVTRYRSTSLGLVAPT